MCKLTENELAIECGRLQHEIECLQKLLFDLRAEKAQAEMTAQQEARRANNAAIRADRITLKLKTIRAELDEV